MNNCDNCNGSGWTSGGYRCDCGAGGTGPKWGSLDDLLPEYRGLVEEVLTSVLHISTEHLGAPNGNEITASPMWWILTPRWNTGGIGQITRSFCGPFWSRESATAHLEAKRYRFSKKSRVYCQGCQEFPELRALYGLSAKLRDALK